MKKESLLKHSGMILLIILICIITYSGVWNNGFIYDDTDLILRNPLIQERDTIKKIFTTEFWETTREKSNYYRPLIVLSYKIDHAVYGNSPGGFHFSNFIYHLMAGILVYILTLQWHVKRWIALLAALIFMVSPVRIQNVAWISGRTDIIATLFALISLVFFRAAMARYLSSNEVFISKVGIKRNYAYFFLSGLFFFLGLLAKEMVITLPLVALIQEYLLGQKKDRNRLLFWRPFFVFFPSLLLYFYIRHEIIGYALFNTLTEEAWWTPSDGDLKRWQTVPIILSWYFLKSLFPWPLVFERGVELSTGWNDFRVYPSLFFIVLVVWLMVRLYRMEDKKAFFGLSWFIVTLLPICNIFPVFESCMEHYIYFPGVGFAVFAASLTNYVTGGTKRSKFVICALIAFPLLVFVITTQARLIDWRDEITLFKDTVEKRPDSYRANTSYGLALFFAGKYQHAISPLKHAIFLKPDYGRPYYNLGLVYRKLKRNKEAKDAFEKAVIYSPSLIWPLNNLGIIHYETGNYQMARYYWERILQLYPGNPLAVKNLKFLKDKN